MGRPTVLTKSFFNLVSRDAPTPPPMTPLPALPGLMNKLSINTTGLDTPPDSTSKHETKRPALKPFRFKSLLSLNMGMGSTPKKSSSSLLQHQDITSPSSFLVGGRRSPGYSPGDESGVFAPDTPQRGDRQQKYPKGDMSQHTGLNLPPRPGTSLGTYTPRKNSTSNLKQAAIPRVASALGLPTPDSTPTVSLTGRHTRANHMTPTLNGSRTKLSMGPGSGGSIVRQGRIPPPRPSSRPSLGDAPTRQDNGCEVPEKLSRPSLSEIRERSKLISVSPPNSRDVFKPYGQVSGKGAAQAVSPLSAGRKPLQNILGQFVNKSESNESPSEVLPFKYGTGDGWSTPYPPPTRTSESVSTTTAIKDEQGDGYPFPIVHRSANSSSSVQSVGSFRASQYADADETSPHQTVRTDDQPHNNVMDKIRSRFESSAFEYQAFETPGQIKQATFATVAGKNSRHYYSGSSSSTTTTTAVDNSKNPTAPTFSKSPPFGRPGSRLGGVFHESEEDDKENWNVWNGTRAEDVGVGGEARLTFGRSRPLPAVLQNGRESRSAMRT